MAPRTPLLVVALLAGCATAPVADPDASPFPTPFAADFLDTLDHDHRDASLHTLAAGLELEGFLDARDALGDEKARFSDIAFQPCAAPPEGGAAHRCFAAVALNGRAGGTAGGFLLLDATDPTDLVVLSRYRSGSEDNWYVEFTPDGRHVLLTANGNTRADSAAAALLEDLRTATITGPARGVHLVDVTDPGAPRLAAFFPAAVRAINVAPWTARDGDAYVAVSVVEDRAPLPVPSPARAPAPALRSHVAILRLDPARPALEEIARWSPEGVAGPTHFPHDLEAATHPLTDQDILYVAYWDAGAWLVDVTDPARPSTLGHVDPLGPTEHVHTVKAHPGLLAGRQYAALVPETFAGEPSGTHAVLDVTDPTAPEVVARWTLPGDVTNAENLLFSPHEFTLHDGRMYASEYHAGTWILALPELVPVATWQASAGDPARTDDWAVDVETAVWRDGYIYAVDMGTGVLVLRETP